MLVRTPREAVALAASPPSDLLPAVEVVVVDLGAEPGVDVSSLRSMPSVVVGLGQLESPDAVRLDAVDVVVPDEQAAAVVLDAVAANPLTATALVLHLRTSEGLGIEEALVAESVCYSMLQGGPEHRRWLESRVPSQVGVTDDGDRVRITHEHGRLHIALARQQVRNAVDALMQQAIVDALACVGDDDEILLTGEGPSFSSGGDLQEFGSRADPASAHLIRLARSPARALARVAARTTVVVHGANFGAGVELPAFAHRVVAREDATFTLPEVSLGLIPGAGGTVSIPRRIGRQRTAWFALTGETIDAATALEWGLVDEIAGLR